MQRITIVIERYHEVSRNVPISQGEILFRCAGRETCYEVWACRICWRNLIKVSSKDLRKKCEFNLYFLIICKCRKGKLLNMFLHSNENKHVKSNAKQCAIVIWVCR